ncbi:homeobox domain-containing protein [Deltaproteobacteria bacterium TL4]
MRRITWGFLMGMLITITGCEQSYLYPSPFHEGIRYYCTTVFGAEHSLNKSWRQSLAEVLTISENQVTVFFNNDRSYSFPLNNDIQLPPGTYRCR